MEWKQTGDDLFVRLDPGEELIGSLKTVAGEEKVRVAAITAGIGMFREARVGFFHPDEDRCDEHILTGEYEICSLQGNITMHEGEPFPHVHGVFADPQGKALGGHILEAVCCVTMEIFLRRLDAMPVKRSKVPGAPGTRIVPND